MRYAGGDLSLGCDVMICESRKTVLLWCFRVIIPFTAIFQLISNLVIKYAVYKTCCTHACYTES